MAIDYSPEALAGNLTGQSIGFLNRILGLDLEKTGVLVEPMNTPSYSKAWYLNSHPRFEENPCV